MIRDAVLHINNEQPLMADLFEAPSAGDVGLRCTNLRTMSGTRPIFIDDTASIFFFPYHLVRFVEISVASLTGSDPDLALALPKPVQPPPAPEPEPELEIDDDFLRRVREV